MTLETTIRAAAAAARRVLENPDADPLERQKATIDLTRVAGFLLEQTEPGDLLLVGEILALLPLARKYAEGLFLEKLDRLQDILLEVRLMAEKKMP